MSATTIKGNFRAMVFGNQNQCFFPLNTSGSYVYEFDDLEKAKKGAAALLQHSSYKQYFTAGYDILILDMDSGKLVSRAKTEVPGLEWKDAA